MSIDIDKLADLARLSIPDEEKESVAQDLEAIIGFVTEVQSVTLTEQEHPMEKVNIFREDVVAPIAAEYDLIEAAPEHQDHFVKVPKVIE